MLKDKYRYLKYKQMQITIIFMKTSRMSHHGSAENGGYIYVLIQNLW